MSHFKVEWASFKSYFDDTFVNEGESTLPIFYFEDESSFYFFKVFKAGTVWTQMLKSNLEDLDGFVFEFVKGLTQIVELPFEVRR